MKTPPTIITQTVTDLSSAMFPTEVGRILSTAGLTLLEYEVLDAVSRSQPPVTQVAIQQAMTSVGRSATNVGTLSRTITRMVGRKLLKREDGPNRRTNTISITKQGEVLRNKVARRCHALVFEIQGQAQHQSTEKRKRG